MLYSVIKFGNILCMLYIISLVSMPFSHGAFLGCMFFNTLSNSSEVNYSTLSMFIYFTRSLLSFHCPSFELSYITVFFQYCCKSNVPSVAILPYSIDQSRLLPHNIVSTKIFSRFFFSLFSLFLPHSIVVFFSQCFVVLCSPIESAACVYSFVHYRKLL